MDPVSGQPPDHIAMRLQQAVVVGEEGVREDGCVPVLELDGTDRSALQGAGKPAQDLHLGTLDVELQQIDAGQVELVEREIAGRDRFLEPGRRGVVRIVVHRGPART